MCLGCAHRVNDDNALRHQPLSKKEALEIMCIDHMGETRVVQTPKPRYMGRLPVVVHARKFSSETEAEIESGPMAESLTALPVRQVEVRPPAAGPVRFKPPSRRAQYFATNRLALEDADQGPTRPVDGLMDMGTQTLRSPGRPSSLSDWSLEKQDPSSRETHEGWNPLDSDLLGGESGASRSVIRPVSSRA